MIGKRQNEANRVHLEYHVKADSPTNAHRKGIRKAEARGYFDIYVEGVKKI